MFGSEENRYRVLILAIFIVCIVFLSLYFHSTLDNHFERESEQLLFKVGQNYKSEINSEFHRFISISGILTSTIEQRIDDGKFNQEIKEIFRELIYNNSRLQSIELVLKEKEIPKDSSGLLLSLNDSVQKNSIWLFKTKTGIMENPAMHDFYSDKMRVSVEKAEIAEQTLILDPEDIQDEGKTSTVVPIFSSIYKGKQFLGYLLIYINVDWMSQINDNQSQIPNFIEIFVSSSDQRVITLNKNQDLIAEPIDNACLSCRELLGNKGMEYNTGIIDDYITICAPWQPVPESAYWNICTRAHRNEISSYMGYHVGYLLLITLIVIFVGAILLFFVFRRYTRVWSKNGIMLESLLNGDSSLIELSSSDSKERSDRFRFILKEFAKSLDALADINKAALGGNFDEEILTEFKCHQAYKTTKELHHVYKTSIEKLKSENENLKQLKQITSGLEKINEVLKQHHNDLNQLSIQSIHALVDLLEVEMGAVFILKPEGEKQILELIVSYAYSETRFQKRKFDMGESLVGACAAEKRTIYLKKIPEDYLKIISGLGLASPKSILIVPLVFEGRVVGVIELGSLNDFSEHKIAFTERAAETIANTMSMAEINIKALQLLEQTKHQTLELEKRDKQMLEGLDKLRLLQNKTAMSEASMKAKLEALNNTLMMVEYSSRGILVDANYKYLNAMNFARDEIVGMDVLDLLHESERAELIKIINLVKNGNVFEGIIRRHTRQGDEKWLMATYTPEYNDKNDVERIIFLAVDITRMKKNEASLKHKIQEMASQVEELRLLVKK